MNKAIKNNQQIIDEFYEKHGPCCAGCDFWRFHNSVVGECIKSAPMSGEQRTGMLGIENCSLDIGAGHSFTRRNNYCGEFRDLSA